MAALGEAVRSWEAGAPVGSRPAVRAGRGDILVEQARSLAHQSHIDGNAIIHSTRRTIGPWIIRFQLTVRRATWWFLEPILQQIRAFNRSTARTLDMLAGEQNHLAHRVAALEEETQRLRQYAEAAKQVTAESSSAEQNAES